MNILTRLTVLNALMLSALKAELSSPLVTIGDYANIFFDGSSSLVWQSNVFYDDDSEEDDFMLVITPGFEINTGSSLSSIDASLSGNYEILRFDDFSSLDNEYINLDGVVSYDGARLSLVAKAGYNEDQTTAGQQGAGSSADFIEIQRTSGSLSASYYISSKLSFETGIRYNDQDFKNDADRLADVESYTLPIDVFYELTPKVDLSLGYQYTTDTVSLSTTEYDRDLHFFNVGARGELLPKLSGFFKIGYQTVNPEGQGRESSQNLGLDAGFTYLASPKLTADLKLGRNFGVGSEGQSLEITSGRLDFKYKISTNYLANAFVDLAYQEFQDGNAGEDFRYRTGVRFSYLPNQYLKFSAGYTYAKNDSDRDGQGFVNNIVDISVSLRY